MLATAGESSSPKGANKSSVATGKRSKLDILADVVKPKPPAEQKKVAESIAKELSHWEKVVFSFDMERDTGRSASNSGQRRNEQDSTNPRRQTQQGVSRSSSSSGSFPSQSQSFPDPLGEQGGHFPPFGQLPNISGQQQQYHHQIGAPGLGGLDPYVLQQLAAISALSGPPPQESHQHQGDPFAALRNIQGASQHSSPDAIANLFRGFPPGPPGSSQVPPANLPLPPGIHNPALLNSPAGLQWLAQVQSMGLQRPQPHSQMPPSLQGHPGHGPGQSQQRPIAPLTFPGTSISPQTQVQTPGAGPSRSRHSTAGSSSGGSSRAPSASSPSPVNTTAPTLRGQQDMDEAAIAEDKRRRNTAASARFRIKKKHKTLALERSVVELEARAEDLEREASDLRRENGWLKEMLIMKGRKARAAALEATEEEDDESSLEGDEDEDKDDDSRTPAPDPKGKGKGKQKEK